MEQLNYSNFLLEHLEFAIQYISLHFPFTEEQVIKHWDCLVKGDAYYPVYIQEIKTSYSPKFGLCFNKNIEWTNRLKMQWTGGVARQFCDSHFEPDDMPILSAMIPLDSHHAIKREGVLIWEMAYELYSTDEELSMVDAIPRYLIELEEFEQLQMDDFLRIYHRSIYEVLINTSIWEHTLKYVLTLDLVVRIMQTKKENMAAEDLERTKSSEELPRYHISAEELMMGIDMGDDTPKPQPQNVEFPEFQAFEERMPADHDKDPCYGALNLYEYIFAHGGHAIDGALIEYARKWETSPKKIMEHMSCVHEFLEKDYPLVLHIIEIINRQKIDNNETEEDEADDSFSTELFEKNNGYNGWSDEAIDEAFEGDTEATWNVD